MWKLLQALIGPSPDATTAYVVECNPLVIADGDGNVCFSGTAMVEFVPSPDDPNQGVATRLADADGHGGEPRTLHVDQQLVDFGPPDWWNWGHRDGATWLGVDDDNQPYSWYINRAADVFLLSLDGDSMPGDEPRETA